MSRWFRFYADALRNPKVLRLSDKDFRLWVRLLAVASENDGHIAGLDDLKLVLNARLDHLSTGVERLISGGLIDTLADGYEPHGWAKFQYKSDTSTDRVHKHRAKRNVSETPPDTETESEKGEDKPHPVAHANPFPRPDWADREVWADFMANRKKRKMTNSATAYRQFLGDIDRLTDDEWPPGRLLEFATGKSWGSINDPRPEGPRNGHQRPSGQPMADPLVAAYHAACEEVRAEQGEADHPGAWPEISSSIAGRA